MVSFLPHIVIPALAALAFLPMERRRILLFAPLAWAPDVDYIVPAAHRAVTHSALIPALLLAALVVLWRRRDPTARWAEFATRPGAPGNLLLAAYYVGSHLLLDVFQGGVVLLWPVVNTNFYLGFEILLDTATNTFAPAGEAGTSEGAPPLSPRYPWFTTEHTAIAVFLAAFAAVGLGVWAVDRMRRPRPVTVERVAVRAPAPPHVPPTHVPPTHAPPTHAPRAGAARAASIQKGEKARRP